MYPFCAPNCILGFKKVVFLPWNGSVYWAPSGCAPSAPTSSINSLQSSGCCESHCCPSTWAFCPETWTKCWPCRFKIGNNWITLFYCLLCKVNGKKMNENFFRALTHDFKDDDIFIELCSRSTKIVHSFSRYWWNTSVRQASARPWSLHCKGAKVECKGKRSFNSKLRHIRYKEMNLVGSNFILWILDTRIDLMDIS